MDVQQLVQNVTKLLEAHKSFGKDYFETVKGSVIEFVDAINWKDEVWLQALLTLHLLLFVFIWITRRKKTVHTILFLLIALLVFASERINTWCSEHWEDFSTQNYFDKSGIFTSTVYAVPLIINATFMLILYLWETAQLLIKVKVKQFKAEARKAKKE